MFRRQTGLCTINDHEEHKECDDFIEPKNLSPGCKQQKHLEDFAESRIDFETLKNLKRVKL
jgi:hypothetical protein